MTVSSNMEESYHIDNFSSSSTEEYFTDTPMYEDSNPANYHSLVWPALFTFSVVASNVLSLTAFCVEKRLHTYNNIFIINLTIADLLTGVTLITTTAHTYLGYFPLSQLFCKIQSGVRNALFNVSNIAVVVICIDRYSATYNPINHFMSRNTRKAIVISTIPWLMSFLFWIPFGTIWDIVVGTDTGNHCIPWYIRNPTAYIIAILVIFFIPFVLIANLNLAILFKIFKTIGGKNVGRKFKERKGESGFSDVGAPEPGGSVPITMTESVKENVDNSGKNTAQNLDIAVRSSNQVMQSKEGHREKRQETGREMQKATRTLLFIVIIFVVTWFPHSLISLLYALHPPLIVPGLPRPYRLFFRWFSYSNSLFNPMSYVVTQPLFRSTVVRLLTCRYLSTRGR